MRTISLRDLRNHITDVLHQVAGGASITIMVNGQPVAEIGPVQSPQFLSRADLIEIMTARHADPGLSDDLAMLAGDTTDGLDPL